MTRRVDAFHEIKNEVREAVYYGDAYIIIVLVL